MKNNIQFLILEKMTSIMSIFLYNNQKNINDILNKCKDIDEYILTKYDTIQILRFETNFIDYINTINNIISYLLNNTIKNCIISNNIRLNKISKKIGVYNFRIRLI